MSRIGDKIKEVRIANCLSTEEFQKIMGYKNRTTVTKIETGVNDISYDQLLKFCGLFSIDMNELLDNDQHVVDLSEFSIKNQELRPIDQETFYAMCDLRVSEDQKGYVAENVMSLAEAYLFKLKGTFVLPIAVYRNRKPVGFAMICKGDIGADMDKKYLNEYCILRMMIDNRYQNKGYGKTTMEQLMGVVRSIRQKEEKLWLSTDPGNKKAIDFYRKMGFVITDDKCGEEIILKYDL